MKRRLIATSMLAALMTTTGFLAATAATDSRINERATVEFAEPVKLLGVFLMGKYTIEHDEDRMAKGEDCTYVYDIKGKLVVSFHCTPVQRPKADRFTLVAKRELSPTSPPEIKEIQFSGSTEAHRVP